MGGKPIPVRIVFVTLDTHLAGAVERAERKLQGTGITIGYHAASEWDRDADALPRAVADIGRADIVIATMLFMDDHINAVLPALQARRDACDAMIGFMSGSEVVRLTRMGGYSMSKPASGMMAVLKKLKGSAKPGSGNSGDKQMRMLRRLPKILKFIPGTAQDVRAYFLTLQYWLAGSDDNVVQMVRALVDRYADGPRRALRGTMSAKAPAEYPETGLYHPDLGERVVEQVKDLPRGPSKPLGTVGLLMLRSYILARDTGHYDGVIAAMEARGLKVVPAFASGLDSRPAIDKFFVQDGRATVDAVVSLTGFSLVGGPAYNDAQAAARSLEALDVPYIAAHPVEFQTLDQWRDSGQGLTSLEATLMVAIPELDGAIAPSVFGGRAEGAAVRAMSSDPERAGALAAKIARLVALRRTARPERKLAIVLFNFPPNAGAAGTAAFLGVWESLHATLRRLCDEGYAVDVPTDVEALRTAVLDGNAACFGAEANIHARIAADDHVRREPHLRAIEAQWGPSPGRLQADSRSIHVLGERFGNVFVGLQPAFGWEGDPVRLMFEAGLTPTHAFSAFYRWLREDFAADAVLHFGTHGALEFMPGKQAGLSAACWPERLIGDLPNFYLYAANNPSEGLIAKRRSGATLISYLTPSLARSGLYKGLADLKTLVERWRATEDETERSTLAAMIRDQAGAVDLDATDLTALSARIYEVEESLIPEGLHVLGRSPQGEALDGFLSVFPDSERAVIAERLAANDELGAIVRALDGRFVPPAPGGDLVANPDVLPTGRNLHGFDPFRIPSAFAIAQGRDAAVRLLERHGATLPESIAMVLWGSDNLKSEGAQIAQALALIGARPRFDGYGRLAGAELIPLDVLGRPRIDVVIALSGIFRDLLPLQTRMLAEAAWLASVADEPEHLNFVRKRTLAHQSAQGCDMETASLRVFSNAEGAYGANVNQLIDGAAWTDPDELADVFEKRKGFAYGRSGGPVRQHALFKAALSGIDLTYQNLDSVELGVTDLDQYVDSLGGISRSAARSRGGEAPPVYIVDATQGAVRVRSLGEQVELETRTRALNPRWYEGQLAHGSEGVRNIETHLTTTFGWSATTGHIAPWIYEKIGETFVLDPEMRSRLAALNPKASARMADRLLEASDRQYWSPDAETLAALRAAADDIEDRLEGLIAAE